MLLVQWNTRGLCLLRLLDVDLPVATGTTLSACPQSCWKGCIVSTSVSAPCNRSLRALSFRATLSARSLARRFRRDGKRGLGESHSTSLLARDAL